MSVALVRSDTLSVLVLDGATAVAARRVDGRVTRYAAADRSALSDGRISLPGTAIVDAIVSPHPADPTAQRGPGRIAQVRDWLRAVAEQAIEVSLQIPGDAPFAGLLVESVDEDRVTPQSSSLTIRIQLVEVTIASTRGVTLTSLPRPPAVARPDVAAGQATEVDVGNQSAAAALQDAAAEGAQRALAFLFGAGGG